MNQLRYKTNYATFTDRCRGCRTSIDSGKVLLAVMIQVKVKMNLCVLLVSYVRRSLCLQSRKDDKKEAVNYHVKCFFEHQRLQSEGDVYGLEKLRLTDQNRIKGYIGKRQVFSVHFWSSLTLMYFN